MNGGEGFDVVIVGAGPAGCVAAERLSADPMCRVLLVEAGGHPRAEEMPASMRTSDFLGAVREPDYHWAGLTARRTLAQPPRPFLQGRGVGGTSLINGLIALRPMPDDFARWALPGWSYADVLPSLRTIENDLDFGHRRGHGRSGPMPVLRTPRGAWGDLDQTLAVWGEDRGFSWTEDHNAPYNTTGVSPYAHSGRDGRRTTAAQAFLEPALHRPNLTLRPHTTVSSVALRGDRTTGVHVRSGGRSSFVAAPRVVLAAGPVHSPAVLLRSGIGPSGELAAAGIPVMHDLPGVGTGLQDHPAVTLLFSYERDAARPARPTNSCVRFDAGTTGSRPNELFLNSLDSVAPGRGTAALGAFVLALFHPDSAGRVTVRDADPDHAPDVDLGFLSAPSDLARMTAGLDVVRDLLDHSAARALGRTMGAALPRAGLGAEEIASWLRRKCNEAWHLAGGCRMGDPADPMTVVDTSCRVVGVEGLRIVDASVLPGVPRANTALVTMAVADHTLRNAARLTAVRPVTETDTERIPA
ncbi:GMC family oxidoreductase [Streptomyces sp. NPDC059913]|uniref:GMC family oxidoreductase n=1 Tax=unclassified Streptomyces TaxID=2593676 RepID=UPI003654632E